MNAPNGLVIDLSYSFVGSKHDSSMQQASGLSDRIASIAAAVGDVAYVYRDTAYRTTRFIQSPYKRTPLTARQQVYNTSMSKVHTLVEWSFGEIIMYFANLEFKRNLKLRFSLIATYDRATTLLSNIRICDKGSS